MSQTNRDLNRIRADAKATLLKTLRFAVTAVRAVVAPIGGTFARAIAIKMGGLATGLPCSPADGKVAALTATFTGGGPHGSARVGNGVYAT